MQNQANKLILGATLCCAFPPAHVLDKFKREIEAHAKAVADAADAAELGSETEAAEKAPLCLLLTSSLPTTNHLLGAAREQLPATLRIQAAPLCIRPVTL